MARGVFRETYGLWMREKLPLEHVRFVSFIGLSKYHGSCLTVKLGEGETLITTLRRGSGVWTECDVSCAKSMRKTLFTILVESSPFGVTYTFSDLGSGFCF